jgi:hypothetical protein
MAGIKLKEASPSPNKDWLDRVLYKWLQFLKVVKKGV